MTPRGLTDSGVWIYCTQWAALRHTCTTTENYKSTNEKQQEELWKLFFTGMGVQDFVLVSSILPSVWAAWIKTKKQKKRDTQRMRECRGRVARWKDRTLLLLFTPLSLSTQSVQPDLISVLGGSVLLFVDSSVLVNFHSECTSLSLVLSSQRPSTYLNQHLNKRQEKNNNTED